MHGGAITLARRFLASGLEPELVLATDMLDLTTFLALARERLHGVRCVLYMHENQLTYPLPRDPSRGAMRRQLGERDRHYAFVNYASMLAADAVCFNSRYHRDTFFDAARPFLKHFPEYNELGTLPKLLEKSTILPVGIDFDRLGPSMPHQPEEPPLLLWNQRWEYDKNPDAFFELMFALAERDVPFRLAVCGQQYGKRPSIFIKAQQQLGDRIIHFGYADAARYRALLWEADIVVSTAAHEFFGVGVMEAMGCGTFPILPDRLSYPELLPEPFHDTCLYRSRDEAIARLLRALRNIEPIRETAVLLQDAARNFDWYKIAPRYDTFFEKIVWVSP